jgi:hypothetical protein
MPATSAVKSLVLEAIGKTVFGRERKLRGVMAIAVALRVHDFVPANDGNGEPRTVPGRESGLQELVEIIQAAEHVPFLHFLRPC